MSMPREYANDDYNTNKIWVEDSDADANLEKQVKLRVEKGHMSLEYWDHFRSFVDGEAAIEYAKEQLDRNKSASRISKVVSGIEEYFWIGVVLEGYHSPEESSKPVHAIARICMVDSWQTEGSKRP